jgi:hypothetical protein
MARGTGAGCGDNKASARGRSLDIDTQARLKPGQLFMHTRWLDPDWAPGEGQIYKDAPNAICRITAVRQGIVYFKLGTDPGKADFHIDVDRFLERDVDSWIASAGR